MIKALKNSEVDHNLLRHTKKIRLAMFVIYIICIVFLIIYCALAAYQITLLTQDLLDISIAGTVISAVLAIVMSILICKVINVIKPVNN